MVGVLFKLSAMDIVNIFTLFSFIIGVLKQGYSPDVEYKWRETETDKDLKVYLSLRFKK